MTQSSPMYRIVVGFDFSDTAENALDEAIAIAGRRSPAELHLVSVVEEASRGPSLRRKDRLVDTVDGMRESLEGVARERVRFWTASLGEQAFRTIIHVRIGGAADQVAELASEVSADLLVVGTHGRRGVQRLVMGSVAERVLKLAKSPVLVVRPKEYQPLEELAAPEPPCEKCVAVREETEGKTWWCAAHSEPGTRPHRYSYTALVDINMQPRGHML